MKRVLIFFFLCLFSSLIYAQFTQFAEGPVFPDPGPGFAKILQMKNNSTMFIHVSFTKGLFVHVYEPINKVRTESTIEPAYGTIQQGSVEGIFEINGDAVVMVSKKDNNETVLYRLIIDGRSGKLKEEKLLISIKTAWGKTANSKLVLMPLPELSVRKDPASDHYAVATFSNNVADTGKRIEMILFGSDNKEISRGAYSTGKYKYLQYIDMAVLGGDKVTALLYGYDVDAENLRTGELVFAGLGKTSGRIAAKELDYSNDLVPENGILRYDPTIQQLLLLSTARIKSESNRLETYLGHVDPNTNMLVTNIIIGAGEKLQSGYETIYGRRANYKGLPQNMVLHNDGTFTIIFEEMEVLKEKDTASHTILKNTAVVNYTQDGTPTYAYLIPTNQYVSNSSLSPFYQSSRNFTGQEFLKDKAFKSSVYISDGHRSFLLFNDREANSKPEFNGKPLQFKDLGDADGYYSELIGSDVTLTRKYVFGNPVKSGAEVEHKVGLFTVFDYDKINNVLVVLKQDKEPGHPGLKLIWFQP
ncbi:hypothetical protein BH11BAC4_BH11BAC4_12170 [soil metagenome]